MAVQNSMPGTKGSSTAMRKPGVGYLHNIQWNKRWLKSQIINNFQQCSSVQLLKVTFLPLVKTNADAIGTVICSQLRMCSRFQSPYF